MNDIAPTIGHNRPPEPIDPFGDAKKRTDELITTADRWVKERSTIETDEHAGRASTFIDQLRAQSKKVEDLRKAAVKPLNDEVARVNAVHKKEIDRLTLALGALQKILTPWLVAQKAKKDAEERLRREEADRLQREAEEKARAAVTIDDQVAALQAEKAAEEAKRTADRVANTRVGARPTVGGGRAKSLRTFTTVEITNLRIVPKSALLAAIEAEPECLIRYLNRHLDLAEATPGVTVKREQRAV